MKCEYEGCKREATDSLGLTESDIQYYCEEHYDEVKLNTFYSLFKDKNEI